MWKEGHTYHEIAMFLHCTRSTVAGHIYRHREGRGVAASKDPERYAAIRAAMRATGGNKSETARRLGVSHKTIARAIDGHIVPEMSHGRSRWPNKATDPATRKVIDLVQWSEMDDSEIADRVGIHRSTLSKWRNGHVAGTPFLLECVREALTATER